MNWEWMVSQGLIEGDPEWYSSGSASAAEYNNAVKTAYMNSTDANRKELVDMFYATGQFEGEAEYWYKDHKDEAASLGTAAEGLSSGVGTGPEGTEPRFGLAGGAELWKDTTTGKSYIVYVVPGTEDDPVYMRWIVPSDADVQSFFGPGQPVIYQQQYASGDGIWADTIDFGSSDDIGNLSKSPFDSWASTLEVESASAPWLLDEDYQKLFAMAIIENRLLTEAEIQSTNWWKDNSDAQRGWMSLHNSDPSEATRRLEDNRIAQDSYMLAAGMSGVDERLVNYMADQVSMGNWSALDMQRQVDILSDPYFAGEPLNEGFQAFIEDNGITFDLTTDKETEVRNLVTQWLGTNFGNWDDETVASWAGRFRNEPDAKEALIETLKDQKDAMFSGYDREADYATISAPWKSMMQNVWGEVPDDSDTTLHNVIRMNSATDAGKFLTQEGLSRGNQTVVNTVQGALQNSFGGIAVG